ncbi:MAG TPA: ATP-binding protein [Chitinophagales bacterium]|nr:ATP-binding protein [Chitinophagales bacterium]
MNFHFKKRIAIFNTIAVAITTFIVFVVIYYVVSFSSFQHLDNDIKAEMEEVFNNINWENDSIQINKMPEWDEAEHQQIEVNPTFIQIVNIDGKAIFKSINLQDDYLLIHPNNNKTSFYNTTINTQKIRQGQFPIINKNKKTIGYLTIGVSQEESSSVLHNLFIVLCFTYLILVFVLYLIMYYVASKAIKPVQKLIQSASEINESNISSRLPLPNNKDEIYKLATTFNDLLNRIENSIEQQKQFTADASHEMRTPLTIIKGTLEVLLRKERTPEHYEQKINEVISQTDRLSYLFDQLLQLARAESNNTIIKKEKIILKEKIDHLINGGDLLLNKNQIKYNIPSNCVVFADAALLDRILENIISNAIKYNTPNGNITFEWNEKSNSLLIKDEGIGISKDQQPYLFNRFYRADNSRSSEIKGNGLGLSIVKKLCELQHIKISVESAENKGTSFTLQFPV